MNSNNPPKTTLPSKPMVLHKQPLPQQYQQTTPGSFQLCPIQPFTNLVSEEELKKIAQEVDPKMVLNDEVGETAIFLLAASVD